MSDDPKDYIAKDAKNHIKGVRLVFQENEDHYSRTRFVQIYKSYDFLENMLVIRPYIQKRYEIDLNGLELLLKLMGMRVFTFKDYTALPKEFSYTRFNNAIDRGFVQIIQDHNSVNHRLFTLSTRAKNICTNFYQMLSGEKPIPEDGRINPMAKKDGQKAFDKKKMQLIKKLNQLPTQEHMKKLYE